MLIRFSLTTVEMSQIDVETLSNITRELLRAHRHGYHLLVVSRETATYLRDNLGLSKSECALVERLREEFTQTGSMHRSAAIYIEISLGSSTMKVGNAIKVPINLLGHENVGSKPGLLLEDAPNDGGLFEILISNLARRLKRPRVSFELKHGGGSGIAKAFEAEVKKHQITYCVLDTDRNSPSAKHCLITRQVLDLHHKSTWPLAIAEALPCHEIENVIPFEVIQKLQCASGCAWNSVIPRICSWECENGKAEHESFWLFFDIKGGMKSDDVATICVSDIHWISERLKAGGLGSVSWDKPGYGQSVVPLLLNSGAALGELSRLIVQAKWLNVFEPLFDRLLWFFAASAQLKT